MSLPYIFKPQTILKQGRTNLQAIKAIQTWFKNKFSLELQEELAVIFLLSCRNEIETTKKTVEQYFSIKNKSPDVFDNFDIDTPRLKKVAEISYFCIIPERDEDNNVIIWTKLVDPDYKKIDIVATIKVGLMLLHLTQMSDPPETITVVLDIKGGNLMHLTCLRMGAMLAFLSYIQEGMPLKIKNIHVLNSNYIFQKILALFKKVIKGEIISCIKVHPGDLKMESFFEDCIPARLVPKDYGGESQELKVLTDRCVEELRAMKSFFEKEEMLRREVKAQVTSQ